MQETLDRRAFDEAEDERGGYELACRITGLSRSALYSAVNRAEIPHFRVSPRRVIFSRTLLEAWMQAGFVSPEPGE